MSEIQAPRHRQLGQATGRVTAIHPGTGADEAAAIRLESALGSSGWILFTSQSPGRTYQWVSNEWYRIDEVVGCDREQVQRTRGQRVRDALSSRLPIDRIVEIANDLDACPVCDGTVDVEHAMSLEQGISSLLNELSGPILGVGRDEISIEALGSDPVDWRPQPDEQWRGSKEEDENVVCLDCGTDVTAHYRERLRKQAEDRDDARDRIDESLGNTDRVSERSAVLKSPAAEQSAAGTADVGMATGGSKDATNFRDNIHEGYVPHPDALTYEGLFYNYYFDTGDTISSDSLFYPTYSTAVTESPFSGDVEQYITVGLNSNLTENDLERKRLNLVAVVDVSGSMDTPFDQYYYDEHGNRHENQPDGEPQTKIAAVRNTLSALTEQLRDEDQFGVVLYNSTAHVAKPLRQVGDTNMGAIRSHIEEITAGGGTDMSAGYSAAMNLLEPHYNADLSNVENRIVFMTDAMPNRGTTDRERLVEEFESAASKHVHTTFIGIGLDTNADLVESISAVRGANHYFVHSTDEFRQRLAEEFTYMVTPLVFDLSLEVASEGYEIDAIYGSPNADQATGEVVHVTTLFPSPTSEGETRGGVTLLKLRDTGSAGSLRLIANWVERDGTRDQDTTTISISDTSPDHFENAGIRKAVLLSRYGRLLRDWMTEVRDGTVVDDGEVDDWISPRETELGEWEEQSVPLAVSESYQEKFEVFQDHMAAAREQIDDSTLDQELKIMELLSTHQH